MAKRVIYSVGKVFSIKGKSYKVVKKRGEGCRECSFLNSNALSYPCAFCCSHVLPDCFLIPYHE